jgi:hypothetical protein
VPQQAGAGGGLLNDILGSVLGTGAPAGKGGRRTASPAEKAGRGGKKAKNNCC